MFKNLKIRTKIYAFAGLLISFIFILGIISLVQMWKIGDELIDIAEEDIPISNALTDIIINQLEQGILFERAIGILQIADKNAHHQEILDKSIKGFTEINTRSDKLIEETKAKIQEATQLSHSAEGREAFRKLQVTFAEIEKLRAHLNKIIELKVTHYEGLTLKQVEESADKIHALEEELDHKLVEALHKVQAFTLKATLKAEHDEILAQKLILITFIISLILACLFAWLISRSILYPVLNLRDRLRALTSDDADLNVKVPESRDEIGQTGKAFNMVMSRLRVMIQHISSTTNELDTQSTTAIDSMSRALKNIESQQQQTENVASAISQMANSVKEASESTLRAASLTNEAKDQVDNGLSAAHQSHDIIQKLSTNVSDAAVEISSLAEETDRIGEVLDSIRGIADQTNLLALNAAIEAARAGESGRGFAVVADEVRALAQRTQSSTQDIQSLLERLQQEASKAVRTMQLGQDNSQQCLQRAINTQDALNKATTAMIEISALNSQIASATEQQSSAAQDIHSNLQGISENSNHTTDRARTTADTSQAISDGLQGLNQYVSQLKV